MELDWIADQYGTDVASGCREIMAQECGPHDTGDLIRRSLLKVRRAEYIGAADGIVTGFNSD